MCMSQRVCMLFLHRRKCRIRGQAQGSSRCHHRSMTNSNSTSLDYENTILRFEKITDMNKISLINHKHSQSLKSYTSKTVASWYINSDFPFKRICKTCTNFVIVLSYVCFVVLSSCICVLIFIMLVNMYQTSFVTVPFLITQCLLTC